MTPFQADLLMSAADIEKDFWVQDRTHFALPITPLNASFVVPAHRVGTRTAMARMKSPVQEFYPKIHDGYYYMVVRMWPGDPEVRQREHEAYLESILPEAWDRFCRLRDDVLLPLYRELDRRAQEPMSPDSARDALQWLQGTYETAWAVHFEMVLPRFGSVGELERLYTRVTGSSDLQDLYRLMHVMNKSAETDRELSRLAAQVRESPELFRLFHERPATELPQALSDHAAGRGFWRQFEAFLAQYGQRTLNSHDFADPTWTENPVPPLTLIARYADTGYDFDRQWEAVGREAEALWERIERSAQPGPDLEALRARIAVTRSVWSIDEDHHFYLDAMLPAKTRPLLLGIGRLLVARDQLAVPDDIFHLYRDEVEEMLADSEVRAHALVRDRREAFVRQRAATPPPTLGTPPPDDGSRPDLVQVRVFGAGRMTDGDDKSVLRGFAASAGVYAGPVRRVAGPEEFDRVQPGDVLVCRTTTPPWTMLFPLVGAIVTDSGGILSHCATVAREYGIPAVVGTRQATRLLEDGERVIVDGGAGTVRRQKVESGVAP